MNKENTEILLKAYPNLYKNLLYFDCGDGWFALIDELSRELEPFCLKNPDCYASQVKEKFATLCFYMSYYTNYINKCIESAEIKSARTCEMCGKLGKIINNGWLSIACDECSQKK